MPIWWCSAIWAPIRSSWLAEHLGDGYEVGKYASSKGYRVIDVHKLA